MERPDALNRVLTVVYTNGAAMPLSISFSDDSGANGIGHLTSPDSGTSNETFDAAGNVLTRTDAKGQVGTYTYDALNRVLTATYTKSPATPISITYSYDQGTDGIGHLTGITEPAGSTIRKITTQWSASFRLPPLIAEPLRITTLTYDTKGNVLTRTVQPTTDATGGAGTGGTPSGTARTWTYTYYATSDASNGQLHTVDGPRTDVSDVNIFGHG